MGVSPSPFFVTVTRKKKRTIFYGPCNANKHSSFNGHACFTPLVKTRHVCSLMSQRINAIKDMVSSCRPLFDHGEFSFERKEKKESKSERKACCNVNLPQHHAPTRYSMAFPPG